MNQQTFRLRAQLSILKDIQKDYPFRTVDNVIQNIEARLKVIEANDDTRAI